MSFEYAPLWIYAVVLVLSICSLPFYAKREVRMKRSFSEKDNALRKAYKWDELAYLDLKHGLSTHLPKKIFGISTTSGLVAVGSLEKPIFIPVSRILSSHPVVDGSVQVRGGGSAVAFHGIALGSSRVNASRFVKTVGLKLVVANPTNPTLQVNFLTSLGRGSPARSWRVRRAVAKLERAQALLLIAQRTSAVQRASMRSA